MAIDKKALIAQIGQHVTPAGQAPKTDSTSQQLHVTVEPAYQKPSVKAEKPRQTKANAGHAGKPSAFWIDDGDRRIFHELGMLLYAQGTKPSDSLILRAAIRLMPRDHRFFLSKSADFRLRTGESSDTKTSQISK